MDEEDNRRVYQLRVIVNDDYITVYKVYEDNETDVTMITIPSWSEDDITLDIPIVSELLYLEYLEISNKKSYGRVIVDTNQFCTLDDLREMSLTGVHILVGTPVCMIGEPLEELYIHNCTFSLGDSYYENILEMIDDHNPNMEVVSISNTNIRGYVPDWRINNSRPRTLILVGNDQLIDNTDTLPPLVTHDWDDDTDDHVARAA